MREYERHRLLGLLRPAGGPPAGVDLRVTAAGTYRRTASGAYRTWTAPPPLPDVASATRLLDLQSDGTFTTGPGLIAPAFAAQNTTFTNDMAADGYGWAQSRPIVVDQYGKVLAIAQRQNGGTKQHTVTYSNDGGATWADSSIASGFLQRGTAAYDSANDRLHVLWNASDPGDGIIYRRYSISRDGSHNVTGLTQMAGVNLQLDYQDSGSMTYWHPCLLWLSDAGFGANGALLAVWSARNGSGSPSKNEIRASLRILSNTTADNTAGNWIAPVSADSTSIGQSPQVAYSALVVNNTAAECYPSIGRKTTGTHALDVYLCYHDGNNTPTNGNWRWRRLKWKSASDDWSNGLTTDTLISAVQRSGSDTGYGLKSQLGTSLWEDTTHDRIAFGMPSWKDNTNGDTWGFVLINGDDSLSSLVDVYSAASSHSYAPTGDICYDATTDRLVVSYIKTSTDAAFVALYDGTSADGGEVQAFGDAPVDIPLLSPRLSDKVLVLFRDTTGGSPPYHGYFGTLDWGSLVSSWANAGTAGGSLTQTGSARPAYHAGGGHPYIEFDGVDDWMLSSSELTGALDDLAACTIVVVGYLIPAGPSATITKIASETDDVPGWYANNVGQSFYAQADSSNALYGFTTTVSYEEWHIVTIGKISNSEVHMYKDGVLDDGGGTGLLGSLSSFSNAEPLRLATTGDPDNDGYLPMRLSAVMLYSPAMSAGDRAAIEAWLADKYGITL